MTEAITTIDPSAKLHEIVSQKLKDLGHPDPEAWKATLHPDVFRTNVHDIERFLINRCIFDHLARLDVAGIADTLAERNCLISVNDGNTEEWLNYLEKGVLPCFVRHQLPLKQPSA